MQVMFDQFVLIDFKTGTAQTSAVGTMPGGAISVSVSHDGAEAAVATATQTTILNLLTGAAVRRLPNLTPLAFSWDGSLLAGDTSANRGEVVSISTGQPIWSEDVADRITQGAIPEPAGASLMLIATTGGLNDLIVISPAGAARTIARGVFPAQMAPCSICSAV